MIRSPLSLAALSFFLILSHSVQAKELARVGNVSITDADIDLALQEMPSSSRAVVRRDPESRKIVLQNLIDREVLVQEGQTQKIDQSREYKEAVEAYKRNLLADLLVRKMTAASITTEDAKKYFKTHKSSFSTAKVRVQHILVKDLAQARQLYAQAKKNPKSFQDMAEKFSEDPSAKTNRGDMGFIMRGQLVPEFTDEAFSAPMGAIRGPIKTGFGYHIIRVVDRISGDTPEFEEVEMEVRRRLQEQETKRLVAKLRAKTKIKVNP